MKQVKENRYYQFFCNVPDKELSVFLNPSSLCKVRQRFGKKGIEIIENNVFRVLRNAGVIDPEYALIDSTVLESNIVYPTDVKLVYKAFCKIALFAKNHNLSLWWNHDEIKSKWREFTLNKEKDSLLYLIDFSTILTEALCTFRLHVHFSQAQKKVKKSAEQLLELLTLLDQQNTDVKTDYSVFICLVCGYDTICVLDADDIENLIDIDWDEAQWIKVDYPSGGSMRVSGSEGELSRKIPHNSFPKILFGYRNMSTK